MFDSTTVSTLWKSILSNNFIWTEHRFVECTSTLHLDFSFSVSTYLIYNTFFFIKYPQLLKNINKSDDIAETLHCHTTASALDCMVLKLLGLLDLPTCTFSEIGIVLCAASLRLEYTGFKRKVEIFINMQAEGHPFVLPLSFQGTSLLSATVVPEIALCPVLMKINWIHLNISLT